MKKKYPIPKDFGRNIAVNFFDLSGCRMSNSIYDFAIDLSREIGAKDESVIESKGYIKNEYHLKSAVVNDIFDSALDGYLNIALAIGFALGQGFEVTNPKAIKEMDYIWERMKERKLFFVYPHKKAA